jgi:hypothetical protein
LARRQKRGNHGDGAGVASLGEVARVRVRKVSPALARPGGNNPPPPRLRLIADINSTSASWRARVFVSALMREYVCVFDCVPTAKCGGEGRLGVVGSGGSRGSGLAPGVTACTSSSVRPPSSRRSPRTAYPAYFPSSSPPTSATMGLGGIPWWLGLGLLPRGCFL